MPESAESQARRTQYKKRLRDHIFQTLDMPGLTAKQRIKLLEMLEPLTTPIRWRRRVEKENLSTTMEIDPWADQR